MEDRFKHLEILSRGLLCKSVGKPLTLLSQKVKSIQCVFWPKGFEDPSLRKRANTASHTPSQVSTPSSLSDPRDVEWDTRPILVWGWRAGLVIEVSKWRHF